MHDEYNHETEIFSVIKNGLCWAQACHCRYSLLGVRSQRKYFHNKNDNKTFSVMKDLLPITNRKYTLLGIRSSLIRFGQSKRFCMVAIPEAKPATIPTSPQSYGAEIGHTETRRIYNNSVWCRHDPRSMAAHVPSHTMQSFATIIDRTRRGHRLIAYMQSGQEMLKASCSAELRQYVREGQHTNG